MEAYPADPELDAILAPYEELIRKVTGDAFGVPFYFYEVLIWTP